MIQDTFLLDDIIRERDFYRNSLDFFLDSSSGPYIAYLYQPEASIVLYDQPQGCISYVNMAIILTSISYYIEHLKCNP